MEETVIFLKCFQSSGCPTQRQLGWRWMNILVAARVELIAPKNQQRLILSESAEDGFRSSDMNQPWISPAATAIKVCFWARKCICGSGVDIKARQANIRGVCNSVPGFRSTWSRRGGRGRKLSVGTWRSSTLAQLKTNVSLFR